MNDAQWNKVCHRFGTWITERLAVVCMQDCRCRAMIHAPQCMQDHGPQCMQDPCPAVHAGSSRDSLVIAWWLVVVYTSEFCG